MAAPRIVVMVDQRSIMGRNAGALVIDGEHVSINTEWDIELVEWILSRKHRELQR
jgi:hypothetical protein